MINSAKVKSFATHITDESVLNAAIEWIGANLDPEDVFDETDLENWAINNHFVEDRR